MESVMLFSRDMVASITPDVQRLRAFDKIELNPGQSKTVRFTIPASELAFVGYDGKWIIEAGAFRFYIANLEVEATCTTTKKWTTPNI